MKKWLETWTRDHPRQAKVFLLFGLVMFIFVAWTIVSDWLST